VENKQLSTEIEMNTTPLASNSTEIAVKQQQFFKSIETLLNAKALVGLRSFPSTRASAAILEEGRKLRDTVIWQEALLSGAVYVFLQLASSREWRISGKPRPAAAVLSIELRSDERRF
jgi:hypothetical protein